jgi:hypothetical protein
MAMRRSGALSRRVPVQLKRCRVRLDADLTKIDLRPEPAPERQTSPPRRISAGHRLLAGARAGSSFGLYPAEDRDLRFYPASVE